jgi:hypothetical protein
MQISAELFVLLIIIFNEINNDSRVKKLFWMFVMSAPTGVKQIRLGGITGVLAAGLDFESEGFCGIIGPYEKHLIKH